MRLAVLLTAVACVVAVLTGEARQETQFAPPNAILTEAVVESCEGLADAEVVFVGRALPPIAYRLSFEAQIQKARANWMSAQTEWERFRLAHPSVPDPERDRELQIKALKAHSEFTHTEASYPAPIDMVVTPMNVEAAFRDISMDNVFVEIRGPEPLETGRSYLIYGERNFVPLGSDIISSTLPPRVVSGALQELRFLETATPASQGGTVFGVVELEHAMDPGRPASSLGGLSVRLTSPGYISDMATEADGTFIASGVPAGPLTITPLLPERLRVVNQSALAVTVAEGGCVPVRLRAALDGRVSGRVVGRDGRPKAHLKVQLQWLDRRGDYVAIPERFTVSTNERGGFEFRAIPPGTFLLGHNLFSESDILVRTPSDVVVPATFFPGTTDRAAAIPIVVGNATRHDGLDFSLVW